MCANQVPNRRNAHVNAGLRHLRSGQGWVDPSHDTVGEWLFGHQVARHDPFIPAALDVLSIYL